MSGESERCADCDGRIYLVALTDSVGRQTSDLEWRHYDSGLDRDHPARSRWIPDDQGPASGADS